MEVVRSQNVKCNIQRISQHTKKKTKDKKRVSFVIFGVLEIQYI